MSGLNMKLFMWVEMFLNKEIKEILYLFTVDINSIYYLMKLFLLKIETVTL